MKLISGVRGSGKTTTLLEWMLESPDRVVLVADTQRQRHAQNLLATLLKGKATIADVQRVWTPSQLLRVWPNGNRPELAIDDIEAVLAALIGQQPALASMSVNRETDFISDDIWNAIQRKLTEIIKVYKGLPEDKRP